MPTPPESPAKYLIVFVYLYLCVCKFVFVYLWPAWLFKKKPRGNWCLLPLSPSQTISLCICVFIFVCLCICVFVYLYLCICIFVLVASLVVPEEATRKLMPSPPKPLSMDLFVYLCIYVLVFVYLYLCICGRPGCSRRSLEEIDTFPWISPQRISLLLCKPRILRNWNTTS